MNQAVICDGVRTPMGRDALYPPRIDAGQGIAMILERA